MLDRGQVDDQVAGGAEQAAELLAQGGSGRDAEVPAERGDGVAASVCRGGEPEAGFMSRGVRHGAPDHVSGDRPGGARQALMAAGRRVRVCAFVTSDGIGGTDGFGGTVPLCALVPLFVTSDGIGGTDGFGGAVPLRDGRGPMVAGPGSG